MTLLQLSQQICNKLGKTDTTSLTLCQNFISNRYQMIWDMASWNDAKIMVSQSVPAGTLDFTINTNVDLVISVAWNNLSLENFAAETIMRFNPALLQGVSGQPAAYLNLSKDSNGDCVIRFLSMPQTDQDIIVVGKEKFTPLADTSDSPKLLGIDRALLAFAEADMLERERQRGSAQLKLQEAQSMLQIMIDLENNQQTKSSRITPEIYDIVDYRSSVLDYSTFAN